MLLVKVLFIILICYSSVLGDIKSLSGNIKFDSNSDSTNEVILSNMGLGIGVETPSSNLHVAGNSIVSGRLGIGVANPSSTLDINGTFAMSTQLVSSGNVELSGNSNILADTSSSNIHLILPYSSNVTGRIYNIKKTSTQNSLFITGGGNYVDDHGVLELASSDQVLPYVKVISINNKWSILSKSSNVTQIGSSNLIGWWKLDEESGSTATDSSSQGKDGTINGANWISAKIGSGLDFEETNNGDYVDVGAQSTYDFDDEHFTLMAWIKVEAYPADGAGAIIQKSNSLDGYRLQIQGDGTINFITQHSSFKQMTTATVVPVANWTHITATYDGTTKKIYLNGVFDKGQAQSGNLTIDNTSKLWFGAYSNSPNNSNFDGIIDNIRIYNKSLTPDQIYALFRLGR